MNYTTGIPTNCASEPRVLGETCVTPPLTEQMDALSAAANKCWQSASRMAYFLTGNGIDEDRVVENTVTSHVAYAIRTMNAIAARLDIVAEYFR